MPAHMPIRWLEAALLDTGQQAWVPFELVSTDYRIPRSPDAGLFAASTNGLASGNHHVEAAIAAICEVIERDAIALFAARGPGTRASRLVDPATVDDPNCRSLLDLIERARMRVQVWDITSDIGIAAFQCRLSDGARDEAVRLGAFRGHGCHPDRRIALSRALTEAAQARLTRIAGARDDLQPRDFGPVEAQAVWDALAELRPAEGAMRRFADVPSFESDDLGDDLSWLQQRLAAAGFVRIALVDLTRPEFGIPVVRVIVPGLEAPDDHPDYVPGARATAARAAGV
jgi:YcaO-like protein with predicted kinase domain